MISCKHCRNVDCWFKGEDHQVETCKGYIPTTKADVIRNMTDEGLAEFIIDLCDCECCAEFFGGKPCSSTKDCGSVWIEWLQKEVDG